MGDTVLIGRFERGQLEGKIIVVFEKFNYIAIMQENESTSNNNMHLSVEEGIAGEWEVIAGGLLKSYDELLKYIEDA